MSKVKICSQGRREGERKWEGRERERERERERDIDLSTKLTFGRVWILNNLQDVVINLAKWFSNSRRAWMAWQGTSFKAEYWRGTAEGTQIFVTPLTGRVVLLAAQCLTPADICLSPLPERTSMSLGEDWAAVESTPYYTVMCGWDKQIPFMTEN